MIELVIRVWHADSTIRNQSLLGESPRERKSRRVVAWLCGGTLVLLLILGGWWCWWAWKHGETLPRAFSRWRFFAWPPR